MTEWKTMLEVAQELGVTKRVIKYHKEKLAPYDFRLENGKVYISPLGVKKLRSFVHPKEYTSNFEKEVIERLGALEGVLDEKVNQTPGILSVLKEGADEKSMAIRWEAAFCDALYHEISYYLEVEKDLKAMQEKEYNFRPTNFDQN